MVPHNLMTHDECHIFVGLPLCPPLKRVSVVVAGTAVPDAAAKNYYQYSNAHDEGGWPVSF
jgi:hypothetical protein